MIQQVTRRALDGFGRIYGIVGSIARVNALDVAPPTLVHNVAREAALSSGFYVSVSVSVTTAGAGADTFNSSTRANFLAGSEVAAMMQEAGLNVNGVDTWLVGLGGIVTAATAANFSRLRVGVNLGTLTGSGANYMLKRYDAAETAMVSGGSVFLRDDGPETEFGWWVTPIFLPDDTTTALLAEANDNAGGAITAVGLFHLWIGAKGVNPPGVA